MSSLARTPRSSAVAYSFSHYRAAAALFASMSAAGLLHAQNTTWNFPSYNNATTWNTAGNWTNGIPTASNTAIFSAFGDQIITVGTGQVTGGITFSSSGDTTNDYYFNGGTLLPSAGTVIQTDSTFRGVANFNTPLSLQGVLTLTANGQPGSGLFFGGYVSANASAGNVVLNLNGSNLGSPISGAAQQTLNNPISHISGPITQGLAFTATTTANSASVTVSSVTGLVVGQQIYGNTNIPAGTTIQSIGPGNVITLSANATGAATNATSFAANAGTTLKVVKSGTGSWILAAANSYTGGTDLNGGMLILNNASALGTTGTVSVLSNTTVRTAVAQNDFSGRLSIADGATLTYDTSGIGSTMAGVIATSGSSNSAGFTKAGLGELTLTMAGGSQTWRGDTTINAGNLFVSLNALSAIDRTNVLSPDSRLILGGGAIRWQGKIGQTTTQTFNNTLIKPGVSQFIMATGSGTNIFNLGTITREPGGLLNMVSVSNFTLNTTSANDSAGAIKGVLWGVGNDFARVNAGSLASVAYNTQNNAANWTSSSDIYQTGAAVSGTVGTGGTTDIGGLKLNAAGTNSFTIDGTLRTANGIIFGSNIGNNSSVISGGSLTSTAGDLIIVNNNAANNPGRNTISSTIVDNGSPTNVILYNAAQGTAPASAALVLTGNNTYTGNTYVGGGQNNATGTSLTVIGGAANASIGSPGATVFVNGGTGGPNNVLRVGNQDAFGDVRGTIDLVNGRLSLGRTDAFTLSATVRGTTGAGSISQDSTGNATVNLAAGNHLFQSLGSTANGTLNLAGSGIYEFTGGAGSFTTGSTTNFNSGSYFFGAPINTGTNSVGTWNINGANVTLAGGRWFNSAGGTVTLNSGSFRVNGFPLNSEAQGSGNITYNVTGGTFITVMHSNSGGTVSLGLGTGTAAATGSTVFNQSGGDVIVGAPSNPLVSSTTSSNLGIGGAGSVHTSTYNLSGGKLRVFGGIASMGAPATGGVNNFNWTGGTLTTVSYNGANLNSSGVLNTLVQDGASTVMSPGDTYEGVLYSGRTVITGGYQINSGTVAIGIGGTTPASSFHERSTSRYDQITVSGATTLGGRLALTLNNGYTPPSDVTTRFDILTGSASGITGSFTNGMVATGGNTRVVLADGLSSMLVAVNNTDVATATGGLTGVLARRVAVGGYQATNTYSAASGSSWDAGSAASWTHFDAGSSTGASGAIAQFADGAGTSAGGNTVNLSATRNVRGLQFASASAGKNYTIADAGSGALTFDNTANNAAATLSDSSAAGNVHAVNVPVTLASNLEVTVTEAGNTLSIGGSIAGSGRSLTKLGAGTLALGGVNTYSGGTTVNAGSLLVNGSLAGGAVTVGSSGLLGGVGTLGGATSVAGTLAPGNSPGVITFSNGLTLSGTSTTILEINGAQRGTEHDGINVSSGALVYGGTLSLSFGSSFLVTDTTFDLFNIGGTQSGNFSSIVSSALYTFSLNAGNAYTANDSLGNTWTFNHATGDLGFTAVPEPASYAAFAALGALGVVATRRRRRG